MVHEAAPDAVVVALQLWAERPVPSVMVTGWPPSAVPLLVSSDVSVMDWPGVAEVGPV